MARQQLPPQIKKKTITDRKTGKPVVRYQVTADIGTDPETGKRRQIRRRYATEKRARDELARIQAAASAGTFVFTSTLSVEQACADWLEGKHGIRPTTRAAYKNALAPLRARYGDLSVQQLSKEHLDGLVRDLVAGGFPNQRRGWTANSINPMLNIVSAILSGLVKQGRLVRDVASLVDRMKRPKSRLNTFSEEEVRTLLKHVADHRLGHAWHLALAGLRRGELGGLRWSDVDLESGTVTISPGHNRVSVGGQAMESDPKTDQSERTLPLTPDIAAAFRRALIIQKAERFKLGPDYASEGYVVCDEAGRPYHPDTLSDYWRSVCATAKVPHIRLHDARHTCATLMYMRGEQAGVIAAWLGHTDPAFTLRTYIHPNEDALKSAAVTLQRIVTPS